jgi:hypothetical protein
MSRATPRLRWHRPDPGLQARVNELAASSDLAPDADAISATILSVGVPIVEGSVTAKDYALGLLAVAAEVEHALMAQYLYAAASAVSAADGPDYRQKLKNIAIQEMGHLVTVQNLLLLVGGPDALHLQRDLLRRTSPDNPLPFVLAPLSRASLAEYTVAEMPAVIPDAIKGEVDALVALAQESAGMSLRRVGAIYAVLRWLFLPPEQAPEWAELSASLPVPKPAHLSDADLRPADEVARFEAQAGEWHASAGLDVIVDTARTAAEAVRAIERVSEQGEGFGESVDSHFEQFFDLVRAFDAGKLSGRALPVSPTVGLGGGGEGGEAISHPYARLWGEVFALQYGLLVLAIQRALGTPRDQQADLRRKLAAIAIKGMRVAIDRLSGLLATLPLRPGDSDAPGQPNVPAGPPYDLDAALLQPGSAAELASRQRDTLDRLEQRYAAIETAADFASYPAHVGVLKNLRKLDQEHRSLVGAQIA